MALGETIQSLFIRKTERSQTTKVKTLKYSTFSKYKAKSLEHLTYYLNSVLSKGAQI